MTQTLALSGQYQVVITLGAVIRGDTPHFDVVVAEVLIQVSMERMVVMVLLLFLMIVTLRRI